MDFTPEYLRRFEEQVKKNQKDLKEKNDVIENLKVDAKRRLSEKDEKIAAQANVIKDSSEENALLRDELDKYHQQEAEALRRKHRRRNIFRFILSIIWKLAIIVGIVVLLNYLENKYNFKIPSYISSIVEIVGIILTAWSTLTKDKEKYLKKF